MKKYLLTFSLMLFAITTFATSSNIWYGYGNDSDVRRSFGTETAETYDVAVFYNYEMAGKTIDAVQFYLRDCSGIEGLTLWMASDLPTSAAEADLLVMPLDTKSLSCGDESITNHGLLNEIKLKTPVTVPANGLLVGYSFKVKSGMSLKKDPSQYPVLLSGSTMSRFGLFMRTSKNIPVWSMLGNIDGTLALKAHFVGNFFDNSLVVNDFADCKVGLNGTTSANVTFTSRGLNPVSSLRYVVKSDGEELTSKTLTLTSPIQEYGKSVTTNVTIPAPQITGESDLTVEVTEVNGVENETKEYIGHAKLTTLARLVQKNVVVESLTGTEMGWGPRGIQGMKNLRDAYGDRVICVAVHQYNTSDGMYIPESSYASLGLSSASPVCRIDRQKIQYDTYYGSVPVNGYSIVSDVAGYLEDMTDVAINLSAKWNADRTAVNVSASVDTDMDADNLAIEYILTADNVHSSDAAFSQSNNYAGFDASNYPADLKAFCRGGVYGSSPINDWHFNDVAIASSYVGGENQAVMNDLSSSYTISMPTSAALLSALDYENVYAVALVTDKSSGVVVNAAKVQVVDGTSGIDAIETQMDKSNVFTINGYKLRAPQRGINIVRMPNGTMRKVMVK